MENFSFIEKLGEGTYGRVWRARDKGTGEVVAIKTMKKDFSCWEECLNLGEVQCLRKLSTHDNIVQLKDVILLPQIQTLNLVFESMEGSFRNMITKRADSGTRFSESEVKNFACQILKGLAYMHENGLFHCDMKPANLLVSGGKIKIADFGFAREVGSSAPYSHRVGTRIYRAPELMLQCVNYTSAVDMWALGAIIAEMFTLSPLFAGKSEDAVMYKICSVMGSPTEESWIQGILMARKINYEFPDGLARSSMSVHVPYASEDAVSLIRWLCSWDPLKRPTAVEAMQHPFFRGCFPLPRHFPLSMIAKLDDCMKDYRRQSPVVDQITTTTSSCYRFEYPPRPVVWWDWEDFFQISEMISNMMSFSTTRPTWDPIASAPPLHLNVLQPTSRQTMADGSCYVTKPIWGQY